MTKIELILNERGMSQGDLVRLIQRKSGFKIGRDRISMICTGRLKNYTMETAVMIAEALEVPLDSIVELSNIKKENKVTGCQG
jgi:transcriptional regulator with XRE-family HTH domain